MFSSHILSEVQEIYADVGIINNGKMVTRGPISEIIVAVEKTAIKLSLRVNKFTERKKNIDKRQKNQNYQEKRPRKTQRWFYWN